jgi:hypothetical protein
MNSLEKGILEIRETKSWNGLGKNGKTGAVGLDITGKKEDF